MWKTLTSVMLKSRSLVAAVFVLIYGLQLNAQPSNDDPCNAVLLSPIAWDATCTAADFVTTDNLGVTDSGFPIPGCGSYSNNDVWFTVMMPDNGFHVEIEFNSATVTAEYGYEIFSGADCSSMVSIACEVSVGGSNLIIEDGCHFEYSGAQMWVRFWDENGETGSIDVCAKYRVPNFNAAQVSCASPPAGDACCDAIRLTDDLDGFCGNSQEFSAGPTIVAPPVFLAVIENNSWVAFTAMEDSVAIGIESSSCHTGNGLQALILGSNDCNTFTNVSNFWNQSFPGSDTLIAPNLTIGETYYIMIDGWFGDTCDYTLSYIYGTPQTTLTDTSYNICSGQSVTMGVETPGVGPYNFSWTPTANLDDPTAQSPVASPTTTTTYTVHVTGAVDTMMDVVVNVLAAGPTNVQITGQTTVCENANGLIYHGTGTDIDTYAWSVTGGSIVGPTNLDSVIIDWGLGPVGTVSLDVAGGCGNTMVSENVNILPPPIISADTPTPICAPSTFDLGTDLTVNNTGGGGLYSYYSNQTDAENGTNAFSNYTLTTGGTYWIRVTSPGGCYDVTSALITIEDPQITPDAVQATCEPFTINLDNIGITETNGASAMSTRTYFASLADAQANTNALTDPNISQSNTYYVRYETVNGCVAYAPIPVTIHQRPDITITSSLEICSGDDLDLNTITFTDANATTITEKLFFSSFSLAQIGLPALAMSNTVVNTAGPYFMRLNTSNGCFLIYEINLTVHPLPTASLSVQGTACYNELVDVTFSLTGTGPFDVVYDDGVNPSISLTNILDGHVAQHMLTTNSSFTITSVTDNGTTCTNSGGLSIAVLVNQELTASLSGDNSICSGEATDLTFTISGDAPYEVVYTDGFVNYTESGILTSPHVVAVSPTADMTYSMVSITDNLNCTGAVSGTAAIQVGTQLSASNLTETCNAGLTGYTVSFDLSGGDPANYTVAGITGSFVGNTFTSDEVADGVGYSFTVSDGSACPTLNFSGLFDCQCTAEPGTMDLNTVTVCQGQLAVAPTSTGTVLDPGFVQIYYLHDNAGNSLGTIYGQNSVPEFAFVTGMTAGATYYISSVIGPDNGIGGHVTTDPCYQVSIGTPVVFLERATADIAGAVTSCPGAAVAIDLNIVGGVAPFNITYTANGTSVALDNVSNGDQIQLNPTVTTTYVLTSIVDQTIANCDGLASGSFTVTVPDAPTAINLDYICNGANTEYQVVFELTGGDPTTYVVTGDPGTFDAATNTFTSDPISNGATYNFAFDDGYSCGPFPVTGSHLCDCTSDAGQMESTLIEACESANAIFSLIAPVTLDVDDAHGYIMHNGTGNIPFTIFQSSANPEFTFVAGMSYNTTYYVSSIVGNDDGSGFPVTDVALDPCLSISNEQPIIYYAEAVAGITGDATLCEGDIAPVTVNIDQPGQFNLVYNLGNGDLTEYDVSNGGVINFDFDQNTSINLVSVQGTEGPGCIGSIDPAETQVDIVINELPTASEPTVTCDADGAFFTVSFDISGGDAANYAVLGAGTLVGNQFTSAPIPNETTYNFEVTDGTGCPPVVVSNLYVCLCTADITVDVIEEQPISCFDSTDGMLMASPTNGASPYTYSWSTGEDGEMITDLSPGMYKVSMYDGNGCLKVDSLEIFPPTQITATVSTLPANCHNTPDGELLISDIQGGTGSYVTEVGGLTGAGFPQTYNLPGGTYGLMIFDDNDCMQEIEVTIAAPTAFEVDLGGDQVIEQGEEVTLTAVTNGPLDSIAWYNVPDSTCTWCETQTVLPGVSGFYSVDVWNANGCLSSDEIYITVERNRPVYIPNAFSPNGDGSNDRFSIFANASTKEILSVKVFSRWGELMYETTEQRINDDTQGWDGRFKAKPMDEGVYIYVVEVLYIDDTRETLSGDVTIIR